MKRPPSTAIRLFVGRMTQTASKHYYAKRLERYRVVLQEQHLRETDAEIDRNRALCIAHLPTLSVLAPLHAAAVSGEANDEHARLARVALLRYVVTILKY